MPRARNICAVVPVKETGRAKQRLARILTCQQRQLLVQAMFEDVLTVLTQTTGLAAILVSTADRGIAGIAARYGARVLEEAATDGHSAAVAAAAARLDASGYDMLALPADIPLVQPEDISHLLLAHRKAAQSDSAGFHHRACAGRTRLERRTLLASTRDTTAIWREQLFASPRRRKRTRHRTGGREIAARCPGY